MKKKTILILLILTLSIYTLNINVQSAVEENDNRPTSLEYTLHDPISITSDSGFEIFPGTGTEEDPFIIEGYGIRSSLTNGINITDTTKHFIVRNCYVDVEDCGIYIDSVADGTATVINNIFFKNNCGIWFDDSSSSTVANNTFTNCGLYISEDTLDAYLSYSVENNWVNSKKLGFYTNLDSMIITEPVYGQLILVNCTNVTVRDQILNYATFGLFLFSCTYSVIINNTCNNNLYGILPDSSDHSTVANNTCNNNNGYGIMLWFSSSLTVANNTCNNNGLGIMFLFSDHSTVANNMCDNNNNWGIYLYSSGSSTVANNTCDNNNKDGIELWSSGFCVVTYNLLKGNEEYGIDLCSSAYNNILHHNNFVDNNPSGTSQACDNGTNNVWYDVNTNEGNYWSDWLGIVTYSIDGSASSIDLYPLDEPTVYLGPPVITGIIHSPSSANELDTIGINATVTSPYGVQSVTLHYMVNGGTWIEVSMTLISGDLYSATIGSFTVGDTIEYYFSAIDNSSNHNEAINDNSGLYYAFTISEVVPEFQMFSLLLPAITFLFLVCGLVVLQRRKK